MGGMEANKLFASVLLAGLIAMFAGFIAEYVYEVKPLEQAAIEIDTSAFEAAQAGGAVEEEEQIEPVLPLLASASVERGERLSRACTACHTFEQGAPNRVGPNQWGIVGSTFAHVEGFAYSDALMARSDEVWDYEALNQFIAAPRDYLPGTKMNYAGMRDVGDRADLIAWLRTLDANPEPLPTEEEIAAVTAAAEEDGAEESAGDTEAESGATEQVGENPEAGEEGATGDDSAGE